jgi:hypothetical protein
LQAVPYQITAGSSDSQPQSVAVQPDLEPILLDLDALDEERDGAVLLEAVQLPIGPTSARPIHPAKRDSPSATSASLTIA